MVSSIVASRGVVRQKRYVPGKSFMPETFEAEGRVVHVDSGGLETVIFSTVIIVRRQVVLPCYEPAFFFSARDSVVEEEGQDTAYCDVGGQQYCDDLVNLFIA